MVSPEQIAAIEASLVGGTFLGCHYRAAPKLVGVLNRAESDLEVEWERTDRSVPFKTWHGIRGVGGYRKAAGWHGHGLAVDLNYSRNGYLVTRTRLPNGRTVYGGEEAGAGLVGVREAFAAACDRACVALDGQPADLSARKHGEDGGAAWDRFDRVSRAVAAYLAPHYQTADALDVGEADARPGADVPPQVAADYAALRVPLVVGFPERHPRTTRNPAVGLIDIPRAVFVALDRAGLRLGLIDFGARASGDAMHADTASRIASGA